MAADTTTARERLPRRGRYIIPRATPRRAELVAALAAATVIAHLLFAQLTIAFAVIFHGVTRGTRWRPEWLLAPAAAGLAWTVATGPGRAVSGLLEGPRQVAAYLAGVPGDPGRLLHLSVAMQGMDGWLPRQLPLALVIGAAEAAAAAGLSWLHTDEWQRAPWRPGLLAAIRRTLTTRAVRAGRVVTADGGCLGVTVRTGKRAAVSWAEAAGGVLCAGSPGSGTTTSSLQLVHAAIRRRKPVIAVDLDGDPATSRWFAAVCGATGTPLHVFGPGGPGCYEPLRSGGPGRRAALAMGVMNWTGAAHQYRRSCRSYLGDVFAVMDAAPGDPGTPVIDEVLHLLNPAALRARAQHIPAYHPRRDTLTERAAVSASMLESNPQAGAALAGRLAELRSSAVGRWIRPAADEPEIDLGAVVRDRAVVLFSLNRAALGPAAAALAGLVACDLMSICADLFEIGAGSDVLAWVDQCGAAPPGVLADLIRRGSAAGMATVLATTDAQPADRLADPPAAVVMHRMTDPVAADRFARLTGEKLTPGGQGSAGAATTFVRRAAVPPEVLCTLADGEFVLAVKAPRRRVVPLGRVIPPRRPAQRTPSAGAAAAVRWPRPRDPFHGKERQAHLAGAFGEPEQRR